MIRRRHREGNVSSVAVYSDCERYRYALTRTWDTSRPRLLFIMLNPSTATERANDPTIARCQRRAELLGYGSVRICNLFAWRETDPHRLKQAADPEGPDNDAAIDAGVRWAGDIMLGWGIHGAHLGAGPRLIKRLGRRRKPILHLGLTKEGHPGHPLYVGYATLPRQFHPPRQK